MTPSSSITVCTATVLALLLGCAPRLTATTTTAKAPLGEATELREGPASPALKNFLDKRLKQELKALKLQGEAWPQGYTADASVLKLDWVDGESRDKVSCTVRLVLLDSTHSPVAIVRGNASVEGARGNPSLAREAVSGATRGAVTQLPSVFQQVQNKK